MVKIICIFFQGYLSSGWVSWRHTDCTGKVQGRGQPGLLRGIWQCSCRACLSICSHSTALCVKHTASWPVTKMSNMHVRRWQRYMDTLLSLLVSMLCINTKRAKIFFSVLKYCQEKFKEYVLLNQSFKPALKKIQRTAKWIFYDCLTQGISGTLSGPWCKGRLSHICCQDRYCNRSQFGSLSSHCSLFDKFYHIGFFSAVDIGKPGIAWCAALTTHLANILWVWWVCCSFHKDFQPPIPYNLSFDRQQRGYLLHV